MVVAYSAGWECLGVEIVDINTYTKTVALPKSLETHSETSVLRVCHAAA